MAWSVIQQPNGRFAVWCPIGSEFLAVNATPFVVREMYEEQAIEEARRISGEAVARAKGEGRPPRYSLEDCIELSEDKLSDELVQDVKKMLEESGD